MTTTTQPAHQEKHAAFPGLNFAFCRSPLYGQLAVSIVLLSAAFLFLRNPVGKVSGFENFIFLGIGKCKKSRNEILKP